MPHLIRVVRRVLGAEHPEVEDVAQQAALAVLDGLRRFRSETTNLHLACRVAVLTAANTRRRVVRELLDTLPENHAQALALHAVLGCTVSDSVFT
jgi:DNA-directed RNA polymerase specialized sigma24 family protein